MTSPEDMSEIIAGADGDTTPKKDKAIAALGEWATWLATLITYFMEFFTALGIKLG